MKKSPLLMRILPVFAVLILVSLACSFTGSEGKITGAEADTRFASDPAWLYFSSSQGIERIHLDGSGQSVVFANPELQVKDISPDWSRFLLTDEKTQLWVGQRSTGQLRQVTAMQNRVSAAAFSPDGRTVAVVWHIDFSLPQNQWKDDDTVYLVDTESLAVNQTLPASNDYYPISVEWSTDGSGLWIIFGLGKGYQWVDLASGSRQALDQPPKELAASYKSQPICQAMTLSVIDNGTALQMTDTQGQHVLAREEGRERGFEDILEDFSHPFFTPDCKHAVFNRMGEIWVAQISTGRVGPLTKGDWLFFQPVDVNP